MFEGVNWNLRTPAERKEPIVVPQLVLGGLKLVSEKGDTNECEFKLVLVKGNGRGGYNFLFDPQVLVATIVV